MHKKFKDKAERLSAEEALRSTNPQDMSDETVEFVRRVEWDTKTGDLGFEFVRNAILRLPIKDYRQLLQRRWDREHGEDPPSAQ